VVEQLYKQLGIEKILASQAGSKRAARRQVEAVFAMVANRTLAPCSKLYCWEQWLREDVLIPGAQRLELHDLYFGMDLLELHKEQIEKAVYFSMADLMNADVDLIFYDTTSLHFEVDEEDEDELGKHGRTYEPQRKRGHSKNGRGDAPQIVVGLAITRDGLPVRSWVFPGNTADVTTVAQIKKDLKGWRLGRCVFVGDAGMNSEENRRQLSLGGGKYILASRMRGGGEVADEVLTRPGRYHTVKDNLRVKEVIVGGATCFATTSKNRRGRRSIGRNSLSSWWSNSSQWASSRAILGGTPNACASFEPVSAMGAFSSRTRAAHSSSILLR
jgi:hypothetical protein